MGAFVAPGLFGAVEDGTQTSARWRAGGWLQTTLQILRAVRLPELALNQGALVSVLADRSARKAMSVPQAQVRSGGRGSEPSPARTVS